MKAIISFIFLFSISAHASVWDGDIDLEQTYACLGIDGVPIGNGSPIADKCCSSGVLVDNPSAECRAGFYSISGDSGTGAAGGINVALNTLQTSQSLNGSHTDSVDAPNPTGTGTSTGSTPPETSGVLAGGNSAASSGLTKGDSTSKADKGALGGGASGGSQGSGGLGLGHAGGTSAAVTNTGDPNAQKPNGGGYTKGGGGKDGAGGSGGFGGMFASIGGGANSGVGAGAENELTFGEGGANANGAGGAGAGDDGDGKGTAEDPSDYFNRIDKSANIFKIVSARYLKKKSLWVVPEKKI